VVPPEDDSDTDTIGIPTINTIMNSPIKEFVINMKVLWKVLYWTTGLDIVMKEDTKTNVSSLSGND
jgi:hypothetical protein